MRVKSEVDGWIRLILGLVLVAIVVGLMYIPQNERPMGYTVGFLTILLLLWIYFGTYYEFRDAYLYCRSGPFFKRIPYASIKSIRRSLSIFSSLALSTKRIEIKQHGRGFILGTTYISPVNRSAFFAELRNRCKFAKRKL